MKRSLYLSILALTACIGHTSNSHGQYGEEIDSSDFFDGFDTVYYDSLLSDEYDSGYYENEYESGEPVSYSYSTSTSYTSDNSYSDDDENYENWDEEDIEGFYQELKDCESDEEAETLADRYFSGAYFETWGRYFARTTVNTGVYEVELGEKVDNKTFSIKGTALFVHFKYSTSLSRWDEGVMDVWSNRGTFFIKP